MPTAKKIKPEKLSYEDALEKMEELLPEGFKSWIEPGSSKFRSSNSREEITEVFDSHESWRKVRNNVYEKESIFIQIKNSPLAMYSPKGMIKLQNCYLFPAREHKK